MTSFDSSRIFSAFDGLLHLMQSIELPTPSFDNVHVTETLLPVFKTLMEHYADQHSRTKKDIASLRSAWTCLASVASRISSQAVTESAGSPVLPTLSEAIPTSEDTTSFLESLADSLKAVEAAHVRPTDPAASSSMASATFLSKDRLLSEAIPSSNDTTSFLDRLAESLEAVEAAHVRPADPPLRPRPDDVVQSCMRGDAATLFRSSWFDQDNKQRVVRVFLSSTFTDTVHERAVLLRCVHPAVQRYARKLNFEVVFSEMRFGIRKTLSDDNKTSEVCMTELERCSEESSSMSYMLLVRNKYGFRPPPRKVPQVDMEAMLALLPPADRDVIYEFYDLDENEVVTRKSAIEHRSTCTAPPMSQLRLTS
jgi:hypothetical protein